MVIRNERPRIWLTPERLWWLRDNQQSPEWKALIQACEVERRTTNPKFLVNFSLAGIVTQNPSYIQKATDLAEVYIGMGTRAMTHVGATSPHGFGARIVLPEVSVCYDWLQDKLPSEDRARWANALMDWSSWVWVETNPSRTDWGQREPGNNFYSGFLQSLVAALAVHGDHPKAEFHVRLGMEKLNPLVEYMNRYGGWGLEGTNYSTWIRHGFLLAALETAAEWPNELDWFSREWDWLKEVALTRWHATAPDMAHLVPFGNQAADVAAPITENHRAVMQVLASHGDPQTVLTARGWLKLTRFSPKRENAWQAALWGGKGDGWESPQHLSLNYHSEGSGYISMRSSWLDPNATWLAVLCGPGKESHQDRGAGEFALWHRGEWLTAPARIWGYGGGMNQSEYLNVPLIGGRGQSGQVTGSHLPVEGPQVLAVQHARPSGGTVTCEFARAYDWWKHPSVRPVVERLQRKLTFFPALRRLNISDTIKKVNAADEIVWQIQVRNRPDWQGRKFSAYAERSTLRGEVLKPANAVLRAEPIEKAKDGSVSSWTLQAVVPAGRQEEQIDVLLEWSE